MTTSSGMGEIEFEERVAALNPVSKVHRGGRARRWVALVVVGDGKGRVGVGLGKSKDVPDSIRKASEAARRHMITVPLVGTTIPHEVSRRFSAARVLLRPAAPGTGVIAGGVVRDVLEVSGIKDVLSKSLGSANHVNVAKAAILCLTSLETPFTAARRRGKKPSDLGVRLGGYQVGAQRAAGEEGEPEQAEGAGKD
jgi:small subunit ribosomal protein S5